MEAAYPLSSLFTAALPATTAQRALEPGRALETRLTEICERARSTWPSLLLSDGDFLRYLAQKADPLPPASAGEAMAGLHTTDLYLCCGCVLQRPAAVAAFEALAVPRLPTLLAHMNLSSSDLDEITQLLRQHLLLAEGEARAKIQSYDGRSALTTWLRTVASRIALNYLRQRQPRLEVSPDDETPAVGQAVVSSLQPELRYIEARYQPDIQQALLDAFAVLSLEQRRLLRAYFVDGQTTVQLADKYRVHNASICRRIHKALEAVRAETERLLGERLGARSETFSSLIDLVRSQLQVSFDRILPESRAADPTAG